MTISSTLTGAGYEVSLVNAAGPAFTWANKPAATAVPSGTIIRITDVGVPCIFVISDGTRWMPAGMQLLARSAVAASVTGTLTETALATVSIPAAVMGLSGSIITESTWTYTNSANTKTTRVRLGGIAGTIFGANGATTTASYSDRRWITNRNSASSQIGGQSGAVILTTTANANVTGAIDTTTAQDLVFSGQLTNTGESITLEMSRVWLMP